MENVNNKRNSNYNRINNLVINGFIKLGKEKSGGDISITELCKYSGVNRTTFYKHFRGIWEIKEYIANELVERILQVFGYNHYQMFITQPEATFERINNHIKENMDYYRSLAEMRNSNLLINDLMIIIKKRTIFGTEYPSEIRNNHRELIKASFFLSGVICMYYEWFKGAFNCSLDELGRAIIELSKNFGTKK